MTRALPLVLVALACYVAGRLDVPWLVSLIIAAVAAGTVFAMREILARPRPVPPNVEGYHIGGRYPRRRSI